MGATRRTVLALLTSTALVAGTALTAHADTVPTTPEQIFAIGYVNSVRASWSAPADDGGSPLTGYRLRDTVTGRTWTAGPDYAPLTLTGLPNGVTLTLRVAAVNAVGTGPESAPFSVTPHGPFPGPLWKPAADMTKRRDGAASAVLRDGRILVVGGHLTSLSASTPVPGAEIYTPSTGTWTAVDPMPSFRDRFSLTTLATGKVLLAGGYTSTGAIDRRAWLFNPSTGHWTATASMHSRRANHTGLLLRNGTVLAAGGSNTPTTATATSETYNPSTGTWTTAGNMLHARTRALSVRLAERRGRVLVAGGHAGGDGFRWSELYQPSTRSWVATGDMVIARNHDDAGAASITRMADGRVLVAGGYRFGPTPATTGPQRTAEIYNPSTGTWSPTRTMVYATQAGHTATLLPTGDVLVAGGSDDWGNLAVAQAYSPATGRWRRVNDLRTDRFQHIAAPLSGGRVLVAGGTRMVPYGTLKSAEIYTP